MEVQVLSTAPTKSIIYEAFSEERLSFSANCNGLCNGTIGCGHGTKPLGFWQALPTRQRWERQRGYGKEFEPNDHFAMIAKKGKPPLIWITPARNDSHISGDTSFGDGDAEFSRVLRGPSGAPQSEVSPSGIG